MGNTMQPADLTTGAGDVDWDDEVPSDDLVGGLDDDEPDETDLSPPLDETRSKQAERTRRRFRRTALRMCERWPQQDPFLHLLAIRCVLQLAAAGTWDRSDHEWVDLVLSTTAELGRTEVPSELEESAGSLAAVVLSATQLLVRTARDRSLAANHQRCQAAVAHLLVNGDLSSLVLFGGLLLWALAEMAVGANPVPAAAPSAQPPLRKDLMALVGGAVVFLIVGLIHGWLGPWPFGG
jgi:hypothetical protein